VIFLTKAQLLLLHRRLLEEFGGAAGVLHEGALESALVAAQNRHWYEGADLAGCAAAYAYHLTQAHAFVDGNMRVAAAAMETFLLANDGALRASDDELYELIMEIAESRLSRSETERWLRERV